jgi:predicted NBD/HSP70 family sugar kinase
MKQNGKSQRDIKYANQKLIVSEIIKNGMFARTDLAARLNLSNPSVSKNVEDLLKKKIIVEMGSLDTVMGRKPIMLSYNNKWGCVVGVDLGSDSLRVAIGDMGGNIIELKTKENVFTIDQSSIDWIVENIKEMYRQFKGEYGELRAISIGTPGDIDKATGYYLLAPRLVDAKKINIKEQFEKHFNVLTIVNNDINLAAKGENLYSNRTRVNNLIYICADYGIGSGLILDGKLYEGTHGFAGEIGLQITNFDESLTSNKKVDYRYSLDYNVSVFGIKSNIKEMILSGEKSSVMRYCKNIDEIEFKHIIEGFNQYDEVCRKAVKKSAHYLGCALKNIIELLDIERIVIGGSILNLGEEYIQMVRSFLSNNLEISIPEVLCSVLNSKATIYGAMGDAIERSLEKQIMSENVSSHESFSRTKNYVRKL